jgi:hypothetical protein
LITFVKAIVFQKAGDMKTSHAMMTDHHRFPLRIQLVEARWDARHGQEFRAIDMATLELPGFTNVEQAAVFHVAGLPASP